MIAEDFIARLQKVRKAGERSWSARCPAHEDKGPSLRVTDRDGTILIHCFAGCSSAEVVAAVGVQLHELFPPRNEHEARQYRRDRVARGTLSDMERELQVALIILGDVTDGRKLAAADHARAKKAQATLRRLFREVSRAT